MLNSFNCCAEYIIRYIRVASHQNGGVGTQIRPRHVSRGTYVHILSSQMILSVEMCIDKAGKAENF
jgi:hypothetical protein